MRTGGTAILPRGKGSKDPVLAGWFSLNGNGEMTGTAWVEESGFLEGPIAITNTHSVGVVHDAIIAWQAEKGYLLQPWSLPVVAETYEARPRQSVAIDYPETAPARAHRDIYIDPETKIRMGGADPRRGGAASAH